jgi:integrase
VPGPPLAGLITAGTAAAAPAQDSGYQADSRGVGAGRARPAQACRVVCAAGPKGSNRLRAVGGYVIADEAGMPFPPAKLSDLFLAVSKAAGLPRLRLHDARHTALTLMVAAGVPISDVSKYAGHHSAAFTYSRYVHGKSNAAGTVLGDLYAAPEQVRS